MVIQHRELTASQCFGRSSRYRLPDAGHADRPIAEASSRPEAPRPATRLDRMRRRHGCTGARLRPSRLDPIAGVRLSLSPDPLSRLCPTCRLRRNGGLDRADAVRSLAVGTGLGRSNGAPPRDHLDRCRGSRMVSLLALGLRRAHSGFSAL